MVARTDSMSAVSTEPRWSEPPAQAKSPSMRPVASAVAATAAATCSSTVTSATMQRTVAPPVAAGGDALAGVEQLLLGAPADGHVGAVGGEPLRRGQPDAAAAAGDEDGPAGDAGGRARGRHQAAPARVPSGAEGVNCDRHGLEARNEVGRTPGQRVALRRPGGGRACGPAGART